MITMAIRCVPTPPPMVNLPRMATMAMAPLSHMVTSVTTSSPSPTTVLSPWAIVPPTTADVVVATTTSTISLDMPSVGVLTQATIPTSEDLLCRFMAPSPFTQEDLAPST